MVTGNRKAGAGAAPRRVAAQAALAVLDSGRALDVALVALLKELDEPRDRALARRLVHGVLRDWPVLDWLIGRLLSKPLKGRQRVVHFLLAVGLHELRDQREPAPAVVNAAVAAARQAAGQGMTGLVNGVLRRFTRESADLEAELPNTAVLRYGYPGWLIEAIERDHGAASAEILAAGNRPPPQWLRVNRRRGSPQTCLERLASRDINAETVPGFADALRLLDRLAIRDLPGFAEGQVSIQDGAAQLAVDWLELAPKLRVLDACAAPGGKSAHILERAEVELTALDSDPERLARVDQTLERLGLRAHTLLGDATRPELWWDGRRYDRILIDAPCSGSGVIRRHPDIRWLRRPGDIERLASTQAAMLDALWPLLEPGGILVYTSCSVLKVENDDQTRAFLERHADARPIEKDDLPGQAAYPGRQILPGEQDCDGFYYFAARRLPG